MKLKTLRMSRAECARSHAKEPGACFSKVTGNLKGQETYFKNWSSRNIAAFLSIKQFVLLFPWFICIA